ncbi:PepSY domain-containing protein [Aquabacterium sp.]|uniref:PepSY domain-containing protein n=1 Tax=Aquabacterium sp. TaxID=1872578 RepID=UPI002E300A45|nr:PepSY domain-containing protein [Aquabacterium sp.]HEX5312836.1 PepSY domain-containing protein [Aquabacterium sp.]
MKNTLTVLLTAIALTPTLALAKADCPAHPKSEWMKESEARAKLEAQGYKIRKFKIDGQCYEIYGFNKEGKRVEIYFDTKTLDIVKAEIE